MNLPYEDPICIALHITYVRLRDAGSRFVRFGWVRFG